MPPKRLFSLVGTTWWRMTRRPHSYGHTLSRYVPWSIILRAVVSVAVCEKLAKKEVRKSPHAAPKPQ